MDHFDSYAAAGNACLAGEESIEAKGKRLQAAIQARALEIASRMLCNPELWADALADFAYWPAASATYRKEPSEALVSAMRALMAGDNAEFGRICTQQIAERITAAAMDRAQVEIDP